MALASCRAAVAEAPANADGAATDEEVLVVVPLTALIPPAAKTVVELTANKPAPRLCRVDRSRSKPPPPPTASASARAGPSTAAAAWRRRDRSRSRCSRSPRARDVSSLRSASGYSSRAAAAWLPPVPPPVPEPASSSDGEAGGRRSSGARWRAPEKGITVRVAVAAVVSEAD